MDDIDIRGGLPADAPLELRGEFTGYNNGPTCQVGLWIANDSEYIQQAQFIATAHGPERLARRLLHVMANDWHNRPGSTASLTYDYFQDGSHDKERIDWAQIAYALIDDEPDEEEIAAAQRDLDEAREEFGLGDDDTAWSLAQRRRAERVARWVLRGER